jgi:hypothetical protein
MGRINPEYARFLNTLPFTHFATFTTKGISGKEAIRRLANRIGKQIKTYIKTSGVKMFWVAEAFQSGDGFHIHALLYCPQPGQVARIEKWYQVYGRCKIYPKNYRAAAYVVKHITHQQNQYDLVMASSA